MQTGEIFQVAYDTKPMAQMLSEITEFLEILQDFKPKIIVDIGVAWGGVEKCMLKVLPGVEIIGIDIGRPDKDPNYHLKKGDIKTLYGCDSNKKSTLNKLKKILNGREIDALFIDGDHHYKFVKNDFEMYSPLVGKGGIVAFHDIKDSEEHKKNEIEVPVLWKEIKKGHNTKEICAWSPSNFGGEMGGIGIIYK